MAFNAQIHTQFGRDIKTTQCDDKEYDNGSSGKLCETNIMSLCLSSLHTFHSIGKPRGKFDLLIISLGLF